MTSDRLFPKGSTVLVSAANGLIGSHVCDQLLVAGYSVRGTVRNCDKNAWMTSLFEARHGIGRFALVEVRDVHEPKAWDSCVKGVAGIAHVFGTMDLSIQDFEKCAEEEANVHIALIEAAKREPSVKSFVFTSSAWAAYAPDASKRVQLGEWSWNTDALKLTVDENTTQEAKFFAPYMALKTRSEQRLWDYVRREKLPFTFNTILPDTVIGRTLQPKELGMPSTAGMVKWAFEGTNIQMLSMMQPQWVVDTEDTAMLYVAALTTPGVDGERLFAFGDRYSWHEVVEILRRLFTNKELPEIPDLGRDQTEVPNQRATELLKRVKGSGWASLEESVKAAADCF